MFEIGSCDRFLDLLRAYPTLFDGYGAAWSLKHFGSLFAYDLIRADETLRTVLEFGPGFTTFFADRAQALGRGYLSLDRSNGDLGIARDQSRYEARLAHCRTLGFAHVEALLGEQTAEVADGSVDAVLSVSVVEHIDTAAMRAAVRDAARMLRPGGLLINTIDIYPRSRKHQEWHGFCVAEGLAVDPPYQTTWYLDGDHCTFLEQAQIRYVVYNGLHRAGGLAGGPRYASHFATALHVARKP